MLTLGEDAARLYLWKPAGVPVFPPHADPAGDCLLARLLAAHPERAEGWPPGFAGGIAHRLDTATSGLVIAARTPGDLGRLRAEFSAQALDKEYLFATHAPAPAGYDGPVTVTVELAHHVHRADRMVARLGQHEGASAWACTIRTGVTHQVRVHAAWLGIPLAGDPLYGPSDVSGADAPRYFLHAHRVRGPGWVSPDATLPEDAPDVVVRSLRRG
jgi:23S rRNA pseudouridine1911/1915/1917 synthase